MYHPTPVRVEQIEYFHDFAKLMGLEPICTAPRPSVTIEDLMELDLAGKKLPPKEVIVRRFERRPFRDPASEPPNVVEKGILLFFEPAVALAVWVYEGVVYGRIGRHFRHALRRRRRQNRRLDPVGFGADLLVSLFEAIARVWKVLSRR